MMRKSLYFFIILAVVGVAGVAFAAYEVYSSLGDMTIDTDTILPEDGKKQETDQSEQPPADVPETGPPEEKEEDFYVLLIGLDYRPGSGTMNTDTIIAAHVIPQTGKIKMISLPRDLRIDLPNGEARKINALFYDGFSYARSSANRNPGLLSGKEISIGGWTVAEEYVSSGMVHLRDRVEEFLDIEIKHTVLVHFETLIKLVDAVGGIEINVERSMQYDDPTDGTHIYFEPGWQTMNGQEALNYARFRQDNRGPAYYSNDFERSQRQQQIITALVDKLTSWKNLTRVKEILSIVSDSFKTDMRRSEMLNYLSKYYTVFDGNSIESIPFEGYWESPYVMIDEEERAAVREAFVSIESMDSSPPGSNPAAPAGNPSVSAAVTGNHSANAQ